MSEEVTNVLHRCADALERIAAALEPKATMRLGATAFAMPLCPCGSGKTVDVCGGRLFPHRVGACTCGEAERGGIMHADQCPAFSRGGR